MVDLLNTTKTLSTQVFGPFRALLRMPGLYNSSRSRNPVFEPLTIGAPEKLCPFLLHFTFSLTLTGLFMLKNGFALLNGLMSQRYKLYSTPCSEHAAGQNFCVFMILQMRLYLAKISAAGEILLV